jgi:hypothetical protein
VNDYYNASIINNGMNFIMINVNMFSYLKSWGKTKGCHAEREDVSDYLKTCEVVNYEVRTLLGLGVFRCRIRVGVRHETCDYIEFCHYVKLLSVSTCQCLCGVWCPCFIGCESHCVEYDSYSRIRG